MTPGPAVTPGPAGRARAGAGALLATVGGLALAGGTTATWVRVETARDVGGVAVTDVAATSGLDLAPQGLAIGLGAAAAGLALLVLRGPARAVVGVALGLAGLAALGFVVAGLAGAPDGGAGGGALAAAAGAVAVVVAGLLVLRPAPPPRLPSRYDLDDAGGDEADDWDVAAGGGREGEGSGGPEDEPGAGRGGGLAGG